MGSTPRDLSVELVRQAAHELRFEPSAAVVIGDRDSDIELGRRLRATTIRLLPKDHGTSPTAPTSHAYSVPADHVAGDLLEAVEIIENLTPA